MKRITLCFTLGIILSMFFSISTYGSKIVPAKQIKAQTNYYYSDDYKNTYYVDQNNTHYLYFYDNYGEYYVDKNINFYFLDWEKNMFYITMKGEVYYIDSDNNYTLLADYFGGNDNITSGAFSEQDYILSIFGDSYPPTSNENTTQSNIFADSYPQRSNENTVQSNIFADSYPQRSNENTTQSNIFADPSSTKYDFNDPLGHLSPYIPPSYKSPYNDAINKYWNDKIDRGAFTPQYSLPD